MEPSTTRSGLSFKKNKNTRKANRRNTWSELADKYPRMNPNVNLPAGARYIPPGTVKLNPPTALPNWKRLVDKITHTPIYIIICHASLCISYASCGTPTRKQRDPGIPKFRIPPDTYILNLTEGGQYCLFGGAEAMLAETSKDQFRNILLLDDLEDVYRGKGKHPFVSSVMRATTGSVYPNIGCTFKEKPGLLNENGVFDLDKPVPRIINEHSLIKYNEKGYYTDETWYLDDIINHIYAKTGIPRGIFVFAGCTSGFKQATTAANLNGPIASAIVDGVQLIRDAEYEYRSIVPTLDRKTIMREAPEHMAINLGHSGIIAQEDPTLMAKFTVNAGEKDVRTLFGNIPKRDPVNYAKAMDLVSKKQKP